MEKLKTENALELLSEDLLKFLDTNKIKEYTPYEFKNSIFQIIWINKDGVDETDGGDAYYYKSTMIHGWDIYLLKTLSKESKRRKLFHEILEIYARDQGLETEEEAHAMTIAQEEKIFGKRE